MPPPPVPNGQAPAVPPAQQAPAAQPADSMGNGGFNMNDPMVREAIAPPYVPDMLTRHKQEFSMEFANPLTSGDVLDSFDFDSFLHDGDGGDGGFDFNAPSFMEGSGETIGAE